MAITRTAKGVNSSKADTTSLSVNDVAIDAGTVILVGVVFFAAAGNPEVKYGKKTLKRDKTSNNTNAGIRCQLYRARVKNDRTRDVVCTWGTSTPGARAMFVTQLSEASVEDISTNNFNNASTTPNTSSAGTSTVADTISIALFGSNGPSGDTQGTAGLGHTLGQRVGTAGGGPLTNVTIQETYELLSATGTVRASLSSVTSRDWSNLIVAYASGEVYTITRADYYPFDGFPDMESVRFVVENAANDVGFTVSIPRRDFEDMTDAEVSTYIRSRCQWQADKSLDDAPSPDFEPDATFNTRVSSFVNDEFSV